MADKFQALTQKHIEFIEQQHLFFVGTADVEGLVNVSPKGMDSFRVIDNTHIVWLNLTGSGNETAAHVLANKRMTVMFCSFDKPPLILRLYGDAEVIHPRDEAWATLITQFPQHIGARQLFKVSLSLVQTSCGYAVPLYTLQSERTVLTKWSEKHGSDGIKQYWKESNARSLDGKDTGIVS